MHKIFSYLLICAGLLLIVFACSSMYKVFVAHQAAPAIVQLTNLSLQTPYGTLPFPLPAVNTVVNLLLFALFMFFLVIAGGQLARIGCHLLKNERIYEALLALGKIPAQDELKKL